LQLSPVVAPSRDGEGRAPPESMLVLPPPPRRIPQHPAISFSLLDSIFAANPHGHEAARVRSGVSPSRLSPARHTLCALAKGIGGLGKRYGTSVTNGLGLLARSPRIMRSRMAIRRRSVARRASASSKSTTLKICSRSTRLCRAERLSSTRTPVSTSAQWPDEGQRDGATFVLGSLPVIPFLGPA
jgi:hypothetical protein